MTLPNFLVIGAQRSGTTWLDAQLRTHPRIWLPARRKEVMFFDRYHEKGVEWYSEFFPPSPHEFVAVGEVSPGYLISREAPARVHDLLPECRLVAILRNPVDRLYSSYGLAMSSGRPGTFEEWLNPAAIRAGRYATSLARYLEFYPRERLHIMLFEDAIRHPSKAFQDVAAFLDVAADGFDLDRAKRKVHPTAPPRFSGPLRLARKAGKQLRRWDLDPLVNLAKRIGARSLFGRGGKLPGLDPARRASLFEQYLPEVERLENLLDLDLSLWRTSVSMDPSSPGAKRVE